MNTTALALASIGIDIGKDVFHLVAFDTAGKIAFRCHRRFGSGPGGGQSYHARNGVYPKGWLKVNSTGALARVP